MSGVPNLFNRKTRGAPSKSTEIPRERVSAKGKTVVTEEVRQSPPKKRSSIPPPQGAPAKRPRAPELLANDFLSQAAPLLRDVLVRNWDSREEDLAHEAMIRASSELLFHSLKERTTIASYREKLSAADESEKRRA